MLHITNGTSVSIGDTGIGGRVLVWADVLAEGPVPDGLSLTELSRVRERFIAEYFGIPAAEVSFAERDEEVAHFQDHEEVVLWFEHDLFDQLQLIQILDWFSRQDLGSTRLSLICIDRYLGPMQADQLAELFPTRHEVTGAEFAAARAGWEAFRSPDPVLLSRPDTSALPFVRRALLRHAQQFPALRNGLARTDRQILQLVKAGPRSFGELFVADQKLEESIFMGDTTYLNYLRGLVDVAHPLLRAADDRYEITPFGERVLAGDEDHVRANGIDCWRGGVHLKDSNVWRWDDSRHLIVQS